MFRLIDNEVPTIEGPQTAKFEVNKTNTIVYQFKDDGTATGTIDTSLNSTEGLNYTLTGNSLTIKWTPMNTDKEDIT